MQIVPRQILSYRYKNERSVAFKIRQNPFSAGAPPRTPLGELTTLPQTPQSAGEGTPLPIPYPTRHGSTFGARHASPPLKSSQIYAYAYSHVSSAKVLRLKSEFRCITNSHIMWQFQGTSWHLLADLSPCVNLLQAMALLRFLPRSYNQPPFFGLVIILLPLWRSPFINYKMQKTILNFGQLSSNNSTQQPATTSVDVDHSSGRVMAAAADAAAGAAKTV